MNFPMLTFATFHGEEVSQAAAREDKVNSFERDVLMVARREIFQNSKPAQ